MVANVSGPPAVVQTSAERGELGIPLMRYTTTTSTTTSAPKVANMETFVYQGGVNNREKVQPELPQRPRPDLAQQTAAEYERNQLAVSQPVNIVPEAPMRVAQPQVIRMQQVVSKKPAQRKEQQKKVTKVSAAKDPNRTQFWRQQQTRSGRTQQRQRQQNRQQSNRASNVRSSQRSASSDRRRASRNSSARLQSRNVEYGRSSVSYAEEDPVYTS